MTEYTEPIPTKSSRWSEFWRQLTENPVTMKELRSRMRGARAFVVLTVYLIVMAAFVLFTYLVVVLADGSSSNSRIAGQSIFFTLVAVQGFLVVFICPAFTAGSITGEKERQTFELLRTTLLTPRRMVFGKLISALSYVFLLILSAVPLISIGFMLGGVALSEVIISQVMLLVAAVTYSMVGLYFSSVMRTTIGASVATYILLAAVLIGLPILYGFGAAIGSSLTLAGGSRADDIFEIVIAVTGVIGSFFNMPAAMIFSDVVLRQENTLWGFFPYSGRSFYIISPWYGAIVVHLLLAWFYYRWTVRRVAKIADQ